MYCVKCKTKTNTSNITNEISKNGKPYIKGKCKICKSLKTKFMSKEEIENAKKGGFVITIPALAAAAGALGSLAGGAAGIATAVNKKKNDDKVLKETIRHNKALEKKSGNGLYLKSAKKGKGLHLKPYKK